MSEKKYNIFPEPGAELTILEGDALPQKAPEKIIISGDISTVATFLKLRRTSDPQCGRQLVTNERSYIEQDKKNRTIKLFIDPEDFYGAIISGKLEESDEIKPFCINTTQTFSRESMVKLIKFSRRFFPDTAEWSNLLQAFQTFVAKTAGDIQQGNDNRGNRNSVNNRTLSDTNIPESFKLNLPLFKGLPPQSFFVEICMDVTDAGGAKFWLESPELTDLQHMTIEEEFKNQLKECTGLVIINK